MQIEKVKKLRCETQSTFFYYMHIAIFKIGRVEQYSNLMVKYLHSTLLDIVGIPILH